MMLYQTDYVEIVLDEVSSILSVRWLRPVQSHEYRHGITETGKVLLPRKLEKLLVNNQRMGVLTMDDQAWLARISIEVISQSSLRRLAIVSSTDIMQQLTNETLDAQVKQSTPYFKTRYFYSEQEAVEWLMMPYN